MKINNISFSLEDYGQEFYFTDSTGARHSAILQLPTTPDSIHQIDGEEWDSDDEEKNAVYAQLRDYFHSQFASKEHGKASIAAGFKVTHLIEIDNYYVAFSANNSAVLFEGRASSYYNVFYFDKCQSDENICEAEIIEKAKNKLFAELNAKLQAECEEYSKIANFEGDSQDYIGQCFDELVHDFMVSEFGTQEYQEGEICGEYYQFYACDIRNDATREALENI